MKPRLRQWFGSKIKELRIDSGLSQEAFADKCGYARTYMSRIETGRANVTLDGIETLAAALRMTPGELFREL